MGRLGFETPTPIQAETIPAALAGRDVIATAATGSGKSAAFGIPLIQTLAGGQLGRTKALILAPTRELAAQIAAHLTALAKDTRVRVAAVYGGANFGMQIRAFERGTEIVVATPGRLLDLLEQKAARLDGISLLVLDEVDRMLDMGFLPAVRRIMRALPAQRQTLFFSATLPPDIRSLAAEMLHDPLRVDLALKAAPPKQIAQRFYTIDGARKTDLLLDLLDRDGTIFSAIVFTRTKARANRLSAHLEKRNVPVDRIHGDRSQGQRQRALQDFRSGKLRVLVATDIAARGIDVAGLGHVVNFDVPLVPEDYVHRIGRTGRAEAAGEAITFVAPDEEKLVGQIERLLGKRVDRTKTPALPPVAASASPAAPPAFRSPAAVPAFRSSQKPPSRNPRSRRAPARP